MKRFPNHHVKGPEKCSAAHSGATPKISSETDDKSTLDQFCFRLFHQGFPVSKSAEVNTANLELVETTQTPKPPKFKQAQLANALALADLPSSTLALPCESATWQDRGDFLELPSNALGASVYLAGSSSSSLDLGHALIMQNRLPVWASVLVEQQWAGRGQMRRNWISPPGNIYAAMRLPAKAPFTGNEAAPALGGLLAEAFSRLGYSVLVKWPNDILQKTGKNNYAKICGILIEERAGAIIAGIGINLVSNPGHDKMRPSSGFPAGCLQICRPKQAANDFWDNLDFNAPARLVTLWTRLARQLISCYGLCNTLPTDCAAFENKPSWLTLIDKRLAFKGCPVRLSDDAGQLGTGVLYGLGPDGSLQLLTSNGLETFLAGSLAPI